MSRSAPMTPDDRRAQLLRSARTVFAARGYHAAGVSHIIQSAGVARGTFYNYFQSKRAVFSAVLQDVIEEVDAAIQPIDVARPLLPQVRGNLLRVVETVGRADVTRLLFAEAVGIDDEGDEAMRAFYGAAVARIQRALHTGQAMGVVRSGDMRLTARCLLGMVKEPAFEAALAGERLQADQLTDELLRLMTEGLLADPTVVGRVR